MSPHPDATPAPSSAPSSEAVPRARLLVVDDEAMVIRVLGRVMERAGFDVTVLTDPREALRQIRENPQGYDVMLTDMSMPGMTGIELARGATAAGATWPVVLLSGWIDTEAEREARAAGIARVLSKPIQTEDLVAAIRDVTKTTRH
ncbi:MAG: response regulator [Gemmatimonadetes bacterium]|nr:response regulator [Gemmatimonadota bacterium]MBT8402381.1 response regulator [Gemmatimonadota bacterium]